MKMLTGDIKRLLDKIYNLRSDDSVILSSITEERKKAVETQERTKNEKELLLKEIDKLTKDQRILEDQGNKLISLLGNINRNEFNTILERLNIDFNPDEINNKVKSSLPKTIEQLADENKLKSEQLKEVEKEMNDSMALVEELGLRKDEALANQEKLNEYIELALKGNINITRDAITSLLEKFDFDENERREAAKILMFPEDALYEYDAGIKSGENVVGKSMADVFAEAKELSDNDDITKEISDFLEQNAAGEKVTFEDKKTDGPAEPIERMEIKESAEEPIIEEKEEELVDSEPNQEPVEDTAVTDEEVVEEEQTVEQVVEETPVAEEKVVEETEKTEDKNEQQDTEVEQEVIEEVKEEPKEAMTKEKLTEKLSSLGIDAGLLTPSALTKVLENYDEELINNNIGILKDKKIDFKVIKGNADLLLDKELGEKISKLLEIGKLASDISLVPSVLTKYDLKGLTDTINVLQISGLDPKKVPLMAF